MTATGSVQFGQSTISYRVRFAARKTLAIDVYPDQQVVVTAPEGSEPAAIEALVHKRGRWIRRQQQQFAVIMQPEPPRAYVSGESYRYLGRQYRLKVQDGEPKEVRLGRGLLTVTLADGTEPPQVQRVLEAWFRDAAHRIFHERLAACYPRVERLGIPYPALAIRSMKTRWGSCSRPGLITLNPRLIQAPRDCIDYVILHELCHLKEHNHSKRYYALLDQVLPGWREQRTKLNGSEFR